MRFVLVAIAVLAMAAGCATPHARLVDPPPPRPVELRASGPVTLPDRGAYVGAWVRPVEYTDSGRVQGITDMEREIGRSLDIVHVYHKWADPIGDPADTFFVQRGSTLMISWAGADSRMVSSGRLDQDIIDQATRVRDLGKPVLLRYRWEMDRPNLRAQMWSAQDYIASWRRVRAIFDQVGVKNVSWVWCPTADGFQRGEAQDFYPGDDEVDWTCVDAYTSRSLVPLSDVVGPFLAWAAGRPKPVIIGEYGISKKFTSTERAAWLLDAARLFASRPQIKAVSYFNSDPEGNDQAHQYSLDSQSLAAFGAMATSDWFYPGDGVDSRDDVTSVDDGPPTTHEEPSARPTTAGRTADRERGTGQRAGEVR